MEHSLWIWFVAFLVLFALRVRSRSARDRAACDWGMDALYGSFVIGWLAAGVNWFEPFTFIEAVTGAFIILVLFQHFSRYEASRANWLKTGEWRRIGDQTWDSYKVPRRYS